MSTDSNSAQPVAARDGDYWYVHRDELRQEQVFQLFDGSFVKLDRRVPGDGTQWYVADWCNGWSYYDSTIEPGDLRSDPLDDVPAELRTAHEPGMQP